MGAKESCKKVGLYRIACDIYYSIDFQKQYTDFTTLYPSLNTPADTDNTNNELIISNNFTNNNKNEQNLYGPGRIRTNDPRHVKAHLVTLRILVTTDVSDENFWNRYRAYLRRIGTRTTVNDRFNYSIKYCKYLFDENTINELLTFSPNKRLHIMKALSSLSKFSGRHDLWKQIIKKYNLLWSTGDNSLIYI